MNTEKLTTQGRSNPGMLRAVLLSAALLSGGAWATQEQSPLPSDEVLMSWKDQKITTADFEIAMQALPAKDRFEFRLDQGRIFKMLDNLLVHRMLASEARGLGLDKDRAVQSELALAADRVLSKVRADRFKAALPTVDFEKMAVDHYKAHPKEFEQPERVRAAHVLIDTRNRSPEEAKNRAEEVRTKALAGADFGELALEYSDEPAAKRSKGDLGFFTRGKMAKEFETAAFGLTKPGEISPVVKTRFGFHVIRMEAKEAASTRPFEDVKESLKARYKQKYENEQLMNYVAELRGDKSRVVNAQAIERLRTSLPENIREQLQK